jgi:hypothetical protein
VDKRCHHILDFFLRRLRVFMCKACYPAQCEAPFVPIKFSRFTTPCCSTREDARHDLSRPGNEAAELQPRSDDGTRNTTTCQKKML